MFRNNTIWLILLILASLLTPTAAYGQSKKQLENEKTKLEKEIKQLNKELAGAKKNTKLNAAQLKALNKKIEERTKLIANLSGQIESLDVEIGHTKDSIEAMRTRMDSLKEEYARVVNAMYRSKMKLTSEGLVLDNGSYNRAFLRIRSYSDYSAYRRQQAAKIAECQQALQSAAEELGQQRAEQSTLLLKENQNRALLAKEQEQKQQSLNASKQQEQTLSKQIGEKEKQRQQLQKQIQKIVNEEIAKARREEAKRREAERKAAAAKANNSSTSNKGGSGKGNSGTATTAKSTGKVTKEGSKPSNDASSVEATAESAESAQFTALRGRLPWPVSYKNVVREYGKYTHASGGVNMNNGIDLSCSAGAGVSSIAAGRVSRVFTTPNGSKGVIIRHGDYMSVYANLGNVSVKEGDNVSQRQSLGSVWKGDGSGVAEFCFQLWKGTSSLNPRGWLR